MTRFQMTLQLRKICGSPLNPFAWARAWVLAGDFKRQGFDILHVSWVTMGEVETNYHTVEQVETSLVCPWCHDTGYLDADQDEIDCDCGAALQSEDDKIVACQVWKGLHR